MFSDDLRILKSADTTWSCAIICMFKQQDDVKRDRMGKGKEISRKRNEILIKGICEPLLLGWETSM